MSVDKSVDDSGWGYTGTMKEAEWEVLGRAELVALIMDNMGGEGLPPEALRRIRGRLSALGLDAIHRHVRERYGGTLYEPDVVRLGEGGPQSITTPPPPRPRAARTQYYAAPARLRGAVASPWEEAHDVLYGKPYVTKALLEEVEGERLLVVWTTEPERVSRIAKANWPSVQVEVISVKRQ